MRIYTRLVLYVLTFLLLFCFFVISIVVHILDTNIREDALKLADAEAQKLALSMKSDFDRSISVVDGLVACAIGYQKLSREERQIQQRSTVQNMFRNNERIQAIAFNWELSALDSSYISSYGRIITGYYQGGGKINYLSKTTDLEGDDLLSTYYKVKTAEDFIISQPVLKEYDSRHSKKNIVPIMVPIIENFKFLGTIEVDFDLNHVDAKIRTVRPYENSYAFLVSPNGRIVSHPNDTLIGTEMFKVFNKSNIEPFAFNQFQELPSFSFVEKREGGNLYCSLAPIVIGGETGNWMAGVVAPMHRINDFSRFRFWRVLLLVVSGFFILCFLVWLALRNITKPLRKIESILEDLNLGLLPNISPITNPKDEMDRIIVLLFSLVGYLSAKVKFASHIGQGEYDAKLDVAPEVDLLGGALIDLKENLKKASAEEHKRHAADEKLNWASRGYNAYNALVSQNQQNFEHFTKETIVWLTKFTSMAIGGLYLVEESKTENTIRLFASHNYNRENKRRRKIPFGEGLVGRCVNENETIYQEDLPDNYIKISSGLGEQKARYLLLIPLRLNQKAFGVIELASFTPIDDYMIKFIEKVGENIAATVMNITATTQMTELLKQQKRQSNEIVKKEKVTQDKIQELLLSQEVGLKQLEHEKYVKSSYFGNMASLELSLKGAITKANSRFHLLLGYNDDEIIGEDISILYSEGMEWTLDDFLDHLLKKRSLKRYVYLAPKGSKPKKLLSFWSLINDQNYLYVFLQFVDVSDFEVMLQEKDVVLQQLKHENMLLLKDRDQKKDMNEGLT